MRFVAVGRTSWWLWAINYNQFFPLNIQDMPRKRVKEEEKVGDVLGSREVIQC